MPQILVVDDIEANRDVLSRRLKGDEYQISTAVDGVDALESMQSNQYDLVLLDIQMPRMDGFGVLEKMQQNQVLRHIPVIVISALDDLDSVVRCIELGADDYLTKPFNKILLQARVRSSLEKKRLHDQAEQHRIFIEKYNTELKCLVQDQVDEIVSSHEASILAMSKLAESKDPETGAHLDRMREYCKIIALALQREGPYKDQVSDEFIENIYAASPLHDIGKVGIPDSILLKPGKLTDEEFQVMKRHPTIGAETLRTVDRKHPGNAFIKMGIEIAESHHEKWDGSGYPLGMSGKAIPLSARILALGDVYDALTSRRCYKDAFSHDKSRDIILEGRGTHFDPYIVDMFIANQDKFIQVRSAFHDDTDEITLLNVDKIT